jgi:endonuclease G, mitochondrial
VFFKSQQLLPGNPGNARFSDKEFSQNPYRDELLIERPQYSLSYNGNTNTANWSAWKVNSSWRLEQGGSNLNNFQEDMTLPSGFYRVVDADLKQVNSTIEVDGIETYYNRGHLSPRADRNRSAKDATAVNIMSNIAPQEIKSNGGVWKDFEDETQRLYKSGKEVYVFAGTHGSITSILGQGADPGSEGSLKSIEIPEYFWKVILVTDRPNLTIPEINATNTKTLGFWVENRNVNLDINGNPRSWKEQTPGGEYQYLKSVDWIEQQTGYDFFSSLTTSVQSAMEGNSNPIYSVSPLLALFSIPFTRCG